MWFLQMAKQVFFLMMILAAGTLLNTPPANAGGSVALGDILPILQQDVQTGHMDFQQLGH